MSEQEVRQTVAKLPIGKTVSLRLRPSVPGDLHFTTVSGRIASVSDTSFSLTVGRGHNRAERTVVYKDVDEIETTMSRKDIVIALVVTVGLLAVAAAVVRHETHF
jgi:hypothetical protein